MVFSSSVFLFSFFPLFLVLYYLAPWRSLKNVILLVFSLLFYAWGEPLYVWLMIGSIFINWLFAMGIFKARGRNANRISLLLLVCALCSNLIILGFYKYQGFVAESINSLVGMNVITNFHLALPVGISFFTLQAITYIVDVYWGEVSVQKNPLYLGMYISMFPQLVAGPIVRYSDIEYEIEHRTETLESFAQGLRLFSVGMGKKVLLANTAGALADSLLILEPSAIGFVGCFSGIAAYTFQIYFDFSGYSDMAVGMGKMMGFNFPSNFNYPYISRSATEFWRRWHMTLGGFFRNYVYIPLGGNRVSKPRFILNTMIVWGLTGIWHGAAWNFILWGLYWGVLILFEKLIFQKFLDKMPRILQHLYCIILFFFGWLLFAVSGLSNIAEWLAALFGKYGLLGTSTLWELQSWSYLSLLPVFIVGATPWAPWLRQKMQAWLEGRTIARFEAAPAKINASAPPACQLIVESDGVIAKRKQAASLINLVIDTALVAVFLLSVISIVSSSYNPFIYFQF